MSALNSPGMGPDAPVSQVVVDSLLRAWGLRGLSIERLTVGFPGSLHYTVDTDQGRRFVTVDNLTRKERLGPDPDAAFEVLERALRSAHLLRHDAGLEFVLAPELNREGRAATRMPPRWALAVFPFVEGASSKDGSYTSVADRRDVLGCLGRLHATDAGKEIARRDSLELPQRAQLIQAIADLGRAWSAGPFSERTRRRLRGALESVTSRLKEYDELARAEARNPSGWVITHGEPHAANTLRARDGSLFLVDWETLVVAPRERDLWMVLDEGSREDWSSYTGAVTAPAARHDALRLYRLWWELSEIAEYVVRFRRPHDGSAPDRDAWEDLCQYVPPRGGRRP